MLSRSQDRLQRDVLLRTTALLAEPGPVAELVGRIARLLAPVVPIEAVALLERDESTAHPVTRRVNERTIAIPIREGDSIVATFSAQTRRALTDDEIATVESCVRFLAARLRTERLESMVDTDALTGIANRGAFERRLGVEWSRASRGTSPVAVVIADIDYFKAYNDAYGHPAGDACLRTVAQTMNDVVTRAGDGVARYGGEEFVALLPATDAPGASRLADRIQDAVRALALPHRGSPLETLTLSLGVASAHPAIHGDASVLIAAADRALYRAKHGGRDRVVVAGPVVGI